MTKQRWERLRRLRPDLGLCDWDWLTWESLVEVKPMTKQEVIAAILAAKMTGEDHPFTLDVPF